jgi:thioester reductase-like protein
MVSTVGVAGRAHRLLKEEWVGIAHAFHNTYEQAKAEAEMEIRAAIDAGLPMTVHRPSMVVGDSRTGRTLTFQVFYFIAEFLSGRRTSGFFPALGDARLDTVPVDAVASAIVHSSRSVETAGRILHLCAGPAEAMSLARLQEIVRERMRQRGERVPRARYVPRPLFRAAARALGRFVGAEHRAALGTLPVFLDYLDTDQRFDDTRTRAWLAKERIAVPDTEDYVPRVVDFYLARRRRGAHAKAA